MNFYALSQQWHQRLDPIYGSDEVRALLDLVLNYYTGLDQAAVRIQSQPFSPSVIERLEQVRMRLSKQEPVQYILGQTDFFGLKLSVKPGVLIPRPETEELVAWILEDFNAEDLRAIDWCSGSGCIALALKDQRPSWQVSGVELSAKAIEIATENAKALKLSVKFKRADLFTLDLEAATYDIMVSNPPYVRESEKNSMQINVVDYEPSEALFVSDNDPLLYYRRLGELASRHLKPSGYLYLEINEYLSEALLKLLTQLGFHVDLRKDSYLKDRMLRCQKITK